MYLHNALTDLHIDIAHIIQHYFTMTSKSRTQIIIGKLYRHKIRSCNALIKKYLCSSEDIQQSVIWAVLTIGPLTRDTKLIASSFQCKLDGILTACSRK